MTRQGTKCVGKRVRTVRHVTDTGRLDSFQPFPRRDSLGCLYFFSFSGPLPWGFFWADDAMPDLVALDMH